MKRNNLSTFCGAWPVVLQERNGRVASLAILLRVLWLVNRRSMQVWYTIFIVKNGQLRTLMPLAAAH